MLFRTKSPENIINPKHEKIIGGGWVSNRGRYSRVELNDNRTNHWAKPSTCVGSVKYLVRSDN